MTSTRRTFLRNASLSAAALALPRIASAKTAPARKNIIYILIDDLGKHFIERSGGDGAKTPHINAIADTGLRLPNAYSMPQCTPTRTTFLTGQYPYTHGWINHWDVPRWGCGTHFDTDKNPSVGKVMQSAGYVTACAGKWQIDDFRVKPDAMQTAGFEQSCMWTGYETGVRASNERYFDPYINTNGGKSKTHKGEFGPDVCNTFLLDFIRNQKDGKKPFFIYYPMILTHGPNTKTPRNKDKKPDKTAIFREMVEYTDLLIGKITKALADTGQTKNTIVVFMTDNGSSASVVASLDGTKIKGGKGKDSEIGINSPLFISCPGTVPVGVRDTLVDLTDLLPTFAEIGGAELPTQYKFDGRSIAKVITGEAKDAPREWICAMGHGPARVDAETKRVMPQKQWTLRVLRDKRYKGWAENRKITRLYDLKNDPFEKNNLINSKDAAIVAAIAKFQQGVGTMPTVDHGPIYKKLAPQPWDKKTKAAKDKTPKDKKLKDKKSKKDRKNKKTE
ncbi:MAG: sulfatase-like hydrolase/transferase [Phycisphaerales bacterium]|jgi:arylsulfatase A-like enzyme|nr:sulfatase-like hydrolase/transferase [Phycisphaerales bacterium]MBT7171622.1 sulfatase-like hydrolase/transferase [Phycisphaerales bacterium]